MYPPVCCSLWRTAHLFFFTNYRVLNNPLPETGWQGHHFIFLLKCCSISSPNVSCCWSRGNGTSLLCVAGLECSSRCRDGNLICTAPAVLPSLLMHQWWEVGGAIMHSLPVWSQSEKGKGASCTFISAEVTYSPYQRKGGARRNYSSLWGSTLASRGGSNPRCKGDGFFTWKSFTITQRPCLWALMHLVCSSFILRCRVRSDQVRIEIYYLLPLWP